MEVAGFTIGKSVSAFNEQCRSLELLDVYSKIDQSLARYTNVQIGPEMPHQVPAHRKGWSSVSRNSIHKQQRLAGGLDRTLSDDHNCVFRYRNSSETGVDCIDPPTRRGWSGQQLFDVTLGHDHETLLEIVPSGFRVSGTRGFDQQRGGTE